MLELTDQIARIEINYSKRVCLFWTRDYTREIIIDYSLNGHVSNPRIFVFDAYEIGGKYYETVNDCLKIKIKLFIYNYIKNKHKSK